MAELGRDCVGAIQLLNGNGETTDLFSVNYRPLSEAEIAAILRNTTAALLPGRQDDNDDLHLSIAGAQEKARRRESAGARGVKYLREGRAGLAPEHQSKPLVGNTRRTGMARCNFAFLLTRNRLKLQI